VIGRSILFAAHMAACAHLPGAVLRIVCESSRGRFTASNAQKLLASPRGSTEERRASIIFLNSDHRLASVAVDAGDSSADSRLLPIHDNSTVSALTGTASRIYSNGFTTKNPAIGLRA
jgi:hypothetical protein